MSNFGPVSFSHHGANGGTPRPADAFPHPRTLFCIPAPPDPAPLALIEAVAREGLRIEPANSAYTLAERVGQFTPSAVAGVVLDLHTCLDRDIKAITILKRFGLTVLVINGSLRPQRLHAAIAAGAEAWAERVPERKTLTVVQPRQQNSPHAPLNITVPAAETPAACTTNFTQAPDALAALFDTRDAMVRPDAMSIDPADRFEELAAAPLLSEDEMRALLGAVE